METWIGVTPIFIGSIIAIFKTFIPKEDDIRYRIDLLHEKLQEKMSFKLRELIIHYVDIPMSADTKNVTEEKFNYSLEYIKESLISSEVLSKTEKIRKKISWIYTFLFITIVASLCSLILSLNNYPINTNWSVTSIVFLQALSVFYSRNLDGKLIEYEKNK